MTARPDMARAALALVSFGWGVSVGAILRPGKGTSVVAFARQVAMYLMHTSLSMTMDSVGSAVGRDRTTVMHACHAIEDARDDPALDARLDAIDAALRCAMEAQI